MKFITTCCVLMTLVGCGAAEDAQREAERARRAEQAAWAAAEQSESAESEPVAEPPGATVAEDTDNAPATVVPPDETTIVLEPRQAVMPGLVNYYRPNRIQLVDTPQEELVAEPDYHSETPRYGVMIVGDAADNWVTIALDEVDAESSRIYIDRNNDQDLTNDGPGEWSENSSSTLRLSQVSIDVPYQSETIPATFEFYRFKTRLKDFVLYYRNSAREGVVTVSDSEYRIALLDENADGRYDDLENGTLLIDLNRDGQLVGRTDSAEYHALAEPFNIHGEVFQVASLSTDGVTLTLEPSTADVAMRAYLIEGNPAPQFTAQGLNDEAIDLVAASDGAKFVLLDFWASWCGPCRQEYPHLRQLHAQYGDRGLKIIGVSLDTDREKAIELAEEESLSYPHAFDGGGWENATAQLYRVHSIPQTYLLDENLNIVARGLRGSSLERRIESLLGPGELPPVGEQIQHLSQSVAGNFTDWRDFYELAALYRYTGDEAAHLDTCQKMLDEFNARSRPPGGAHKVLMTYLFFPGIDVTDEILDLAQEQAEGGNSVNQRMWGLAHLRRGEDAEALPLLAAAAAGRLPADSRIVSLLSLALVQLRLQRADEAIASISEARTVHEASAGDAASLDRQPWGVIPSMWREVQAALEQAGIEEAIPELPPTHVEQPTTTSGSEDAENE